jgi:acetyl esterase/lipase
VNGAHLTLRFGATRIRANVFWPQATADKLALVLTDEIAPHDPLLGDGLVVAVAGPHQCAELLGAMCWLAEHGCELGAACDRLVIAGGAGAAQVAVEMREERWPVLHRQVLVHPRFTRELPMPSAVSRVAPATVVHGGNPREDGVRYAALLRAAGVEVQELRR